MGTQPTGNGAKESNKPEEIIDARCIVEFRPNNDWEGEYGFDWFRVWDYQEPRCTIQYGQNKGKYHPADKTINGNKNGATHYVKDNIVGRYYEVDSNGLLKSPPNDRIDPDVPNLECSLYTDVVDKKYYWADLLAKYYTIKTIKRLSRNYIVPWISLFYDIESKRSATFANFGAEAKTSAIIKMRIKKDSTNIKRIRKIRVVSLEDRVRFGKGNKQWKKNNKVIFNYIEFEGPFSSDPEQEITLPVNLRYSISEDWPIKAYAFYYGYDNSYYTLSGQINIIKSVPTKVDVWFIPVFTQTDNVCSNPSINYNQQFGINLNEQKNNLRRFLAQSLIVPRFLDEDQNGININTFICLNANPFKVRTPTSKEEGLHRKNYDLIDELLKQFNAKYGETNAYKVFFVNSIGFSGDYIGRESDTYYKIGGHSYRIGGPMKSAVIFKDPSESTVCHELLHSLGLSHSFSNEGDFTYKKSMTSNIMDYSFVGEKYNCLRRISLSLWQWRTINPQLK